jgi:hypothetical protein
MRYPPGIPAKKLSTQSARDHDGGSSQGSRDHDEPGTRRCQPAVNNPAHSAIRARPTKRLRIGARVRGLIAQVNHVHTTP